VKLAAGVSCSDIESFGNKVSETSEPFWCTFDLRGCEDYSESFIPCYCFLVNQCDPEASPRQHQAELQWRENTPESRLDARRPNNIYIYLLFARQTPINPVSDMTVYHVHASAAGGCLFDKLLIETLLLRSLYVQYRLEAMHAPERTQSFEPELPTPQCPLAILVNGDPVHIVHRLLSRTQLWLGPTHGSIRATQCYYRFQKTLPRAGWRCASGVSQQQGISACGLNACWISGEFTSSSSSMIYLLITLL